MNPAIAALTALAEEELSLIAAGRADALAGLQDRRDAALAALPEQFSETERVDLRQLYELHLQVAAVLEQARDEVASRLGRLSRGQTALRGYAGALKGA